ncbi:PTS glucitol/sorbitol transporter subunit IIA [Clostridium estertheticum]|uniref:PTS glucitol/sorbitol transporter subunit IIA n=1 Tax=Clostridium estertheticum TaxID=238834 RepID=UPI001C6E969A|nr:PTS glucitol/sorbitol transporter subunit IIA [Clostridium estertheticum]MBW9171875.1 PTS glucitol/sorbitol transporter subunit IIA [Clostridium estertheticum]WLC76039.1 PTS glucitol/sorbitol transporter subunit IIA [Clostridium estertheticum]
MMIYTTEVKEIGLNAKEFLNEEIIVLFGFNAPPDLRPYCFLIEQNKLEESIEVDDTLFINNDSYKIIAVGDQVNKNLKDLGHITINFKGDTNNLMAGSLYVEKKAISNIDVGTKIIIEKNN